LDYDYSQGEHFCEIAGGLCSISIGKYGGEAILGIGNAKSPWRAGAQPVPYIGAYRAPHTLEGCAFC